MTIEEREEELKKKSHEFMESMKGKTMLEIMEHPENKKLDEEKLSIANDKHSLLPNRTKMLTVQKLIDFLKTQDPNACILGWEQNSEAYIEQWSTLPSPEIGTVKDFKARDIEYMTHWYKDSENPAERAKQDVDVWYRYAADTDVIINLG